MRIAGGSLRGRRVEVPRGVSVRPTSARAREALFDILSRDVSGSSFLDLFAGTGAVGLEAWSRGAFPVVLVEAERSAVSGIRKTLLRLDPGRHVRLVSIPWPACLQTLDRKDRFRFIFADPPWSELDWEVLLGSIERGDLLAPGGLVIIEHPASQASPALHGGLERVRVAGYGRTAFSFYRCTCPIPSPKLD